MAGDSGVDLDGTRALVTGGTSGIGLAMAAALAQAGATVVLTSRSAERAMAAAARLPGALGVAADASDEVSAARAADQAWSRLGGIDLLVNNAGLGMRTVNPRFLAEPQGFWEVPPRGSGGGGREPDRHSPDCRGTHAADAAGRGRADRQHLDEPHHDDPAGLRAVRALPGRLEALSRIMAADLADSPVRVNMLLPGGATDGDGPAGDVPPG